ncbi:MerR family transcriptional regulator [Pontibacillus salicampi]|uniref:MerR family transcriptional regulator n=1 Tax=Pontibacillus salicampi TaxID=1449801 RepID=A0ABV6LQX7_9BACI
MKKKFRVGEVAHIHSIPSSTLRYYDEKGIFQPKYIDEENQYRYYTAEQFVELETILFLRKLGFSIQDIEQHLHQRTIDDTYSLFDKKLVDIEKQIISLQQTSEKLKWKMKTLQDGKALAKQTDVQFTYHPKRHVQFLYQSNTIDLENQFEDIYMEELERTSATSNHNDLFSGDIGTMLDPASLDNDGPLLYVGIFKLLWEESPSSEQASLPEGTYAYFPHKGSYRTLSNSHRYLRDQIKKQGYTAIGNPIEISIIDESVVHEEDQLVTVIEIPVLPPK